MMSIFLHKISFRIRKYGNVIKNFPKQYIDFFYLRFHGVETKFGYVKLYGFPIIKKCKGSTIKMGNGCSIVSKTKYNVAGVFHRSLITTITPTAIIEIGKSGMSGVVICAAHKINIGDDCALGVNSKIYDTDFHCINPIDRINQTSINQASSKPVVINDSVWLSVDTIILKGVTIGYASIVGAGSVVKSNIPELEIHAGNPCVFIKKIKL